MTPPEKGRGPAPPQVPAPSDDAATTPQVHNDDLTYQRQERARLAENDLQYVRRSYLRMVDPTVRRYRRLLRDAA